MRTRLRGIHPAWWVTLVAFLALFGAAGFRGAPGALLVPLNLEFGWSMSVMSLAMSVNLLLYGLVAPFAAALMDRFGLRKVVSTALALIALGAAGSVTHHRCGRGRRHSARTVDSARLPRRRGRHSVRCGA